MAEERTLGVARARETADQDPSKEELQRRMEEARDSISHTVTEIKDTVVNQYQSVKDQINETLDWREHVRKRPVVWSASALGVGFCVGYCIASTIKGESEEYDDYRLNNMKRVTSSARSFTPSDRYYASHANESREAAPELNRSAAPAEPAGPGLIERFKETAAYDRLEKEVSTLGGRFIEELSKTAQEVVLPLLLRKVTELVGIDLSEKEPSPGKRLSSGSNAGGSDREVYGARAAGAQASGGNRSYETQHAKADRGSGGSALPRPSEAGA